MLHNDVTAAVTKKLVSVNEAAAQLGVSRSHIYAMQKAGLIRSAKLLGKTVIAQSEVDRLVDAAERGNSGGA